MSLVEHDTREWLTGFLATMRQEAKRLRENVDPKIPRRKKPWPRKRGITGVNGLRLMWRP